MLIYVAGPIRPLKGRTLKENCDIAKNISLELWKAGHAVICPHANTDLPIELAEKECDERVWLDGDLVMIARCDALVIVPDWEGSNGTKGEIDYATARGIPIYYYPDVPEKHPTEVRSPIQTNGFIDVIMKMYRVHLDKNADYSQANILGAGEIGIATRLWDKVTRMMNLTGFNLKLERSTYGTPKQPKNESLNDTYMDLAVYGIIAMLYRLDHGVNNPMKRLILAQESDLHGGNKLGLMNPDVILEDLQQNGQVRRWTPEQTESQRELWKLRQENITKVQEIAGKDDLHYIQDGDPTQGNKHPSELVSTRMADQITIAVANTKPILEIKKLKSALFAVGTAAHNFGQASADILMTDQLKAMYPKSSINICYHGLAHYGNFSVDFSHHGPYTGSREWLKGNVARYYLQSLMIHCIKKGIKPPDLVIRGHYHVPVIEVVRLNGFMSTIVVSPSMCMIDDFAHQAAKSPDDVAVGMLVYEIVNDKLLNIHELTRVYETRTEYFYD